MIVALPSATAVTRPDDETVATDAADELHDTLAPLIVAPFWSLTVAESCCVAPKDEKLRLVADSVIEVATGKVTVTVAVALADPEVAVIVAVPSATEVTSPVDETVAAAPVVGAISVGAGLATLGSLGYQGYKMFRGKR